MNQENDYLKWQVIIPHIYLKRIKQLTKNLPLILLFLSINFMYSQDIRTGLSIYNDPIATEKDGFNIGFSFDYQRQHSFNSLSLFVFPELRGKKYTELTFSHGYNLHLGYQYKHRFYSGVCGGLVWRSGSNTPYPIITFRGGYEYHFNDFYIGGMMGYDYRCDNKIWGVDKPFFRKNGWVKIGFHLFKNY